jgi:glycosyltransferase involved in cell wall biosynthesis
MNTLRAGERCAQAQIPPRLLMISNFLSPTRGSRSVQQDVRDRLEDLGYATVAASPIRNGMARGGHMLAVALARRIAYDVAIVDVYSGRAFLWADAVSRLLQRLRCPFILVLHGGNLPHMASKSAARVAGCLARADAVTAPSSYLRDRLRQCREDIQVLPNGVDLDRCVYQPRRHLAPRLVWLRALHAVYNPVMAIETLASIKPRFPEASLTLIGPDKGDGTLQAVRRAVARCGLEKDVQLMGGVDKQDVPNCLQAGDVFLNTTHVDNTPVSVLEAMACGIPVVSTDVGGIPYLLRNGRDALLVPAGDVTAMAAGVERLLLDPETAAELSAQGRVAVEPFRWPIVIAQWMELIDRVARRVPAMSAAPAARARGVET